MGWSRKLLLVVAASAIVMGLVPLSGCERGETRKATVKVETPNSKNKVTIETKHKDHDRD